MAATTAVIVTLGLGVELATLGMTPDQTLWCSAIRYRVLPFGAVACWCLGLLDAAWALGLGAATSLAVLVGIVVWLLSGKRSVSALVMATATTVLVYLVMADVCMPLALACVYQSGWFVHGRKVRAMTTAFLSSL